MSHAWIELGEGRKVYRRVEAAPRPARSALASPHVASDTMEPVQHPCTGEVFTSKSGFRAVTRAHGCVEVGDDPARLRPRPARKPDREGIRQSLKKAREMAG